MARIIVPMGWKSSEAVLEEAFKALGCERWGGASDNGWSKIGDLQRCAYRYYLRHVLNLTSSSIGGDDSTPMSVGGFGHVALAAHYAALLPDNRYPGFRINCPTPEAVLAALDKAGAEPLALQEARTVWSGYIDHWGNDGWTPMAVEMSAGDEKVHTCRYDLVASVEDGVHDGIWVVDHKLLTSKADLDAYQLDGEILGEALCWELSNLNDVFGPLAGVCINALFKGKPVKGRAPYFRRWFPFDAELVRDFARSRAFWQSSIHTFTKLNLWPKSHNGCIARYFDTCLFWDHCATLSPSSLTPRVK